MLGLLVSVTILACESLVFVVSFLKLPELLVDLGDFFDEGVSCVETSLDKREVG